MSDYPGAIDTFRTIENDPGIVYDAAKPRVIFAEDQTQRSSAIVAIQTVLGINPQGAYATVKAWLTALTSALAGKQDSLGFTPENVANKSTTTALGTSDTLYPSQKAAKTYVDNQIATAQPLDPDLTIIAGLTPTTDNFMQAKASAWASRTPAQVAVDLGKLLFPVGAVYIATVATNPATLLGFGTWAATGVGRVLVGKAGSGTFGTAGATGGEETHQLTTAELASHNHTQNSHNHTQDSHNHTQNAHRHTTRGRHAGGGLSGDGLITDSGTAIIKGNGASDDVSTVMDTTTPTNNATTATNQATTATNNSAGSDTAHNNLQPYLVVYMWERTA